MSINNIEFDAIVIGSGISGGWAVKELCEKGMKTLLLERGRKLEHIKDYPTASQAPWEFAHRGNITNAFRKQNPLITRGAGFGEDNAHFFIEDAQQPYVQEKPFDWIRGYQLGGKSIIWEGLVNVGVIMNSKVLKDLAMDLNGPSNTKTLQNGIVM